MGRHKGYKHSDESKNKMRISANHKGKNNGMFGKKHSKETKEKMSIIHKKLENSHFKLGHIVSQEIKDKISKSHKGIKPSWYRIIYNGIKMRSSWEVKYAQYLDSKNIKWEYEKKTFDLGNTTYTPDFYLPETNEYIEIKGWWRPKSKEKFETFKNRYPEIRIKVIGNIG